MLDGTSEIDWIIKSGHFHTWMKLRHKIVIWLLVNICDVNEKRVILEAERVLNKDYLDKLKHLK